MKITLEGLGGSHAYSHQVVRRIDANGKPVTGERAIEAGQAAIVIRMFQGYPDDLSLNRIALDVNAVEDPNIGQRRSRARTAVWWVRSLTAPYRQR